MRIPQTLDYPGNLEISGELEEAAEHQYWDLRMDLVEPGSRSQINFQRSAELRYPQGTLQVVQCSALNHCVRCMYTHIAGICAIRLDEDKCGSTEPIEWWLRTLASSFLPSNFNQSPL